MITITINRSTVKPNPTAGLQDYYVPGVITETRMGLVRDMVHVRSMHPEPEFLFDYNTHTVTCNSCSMSFLNIDLKSDSVGEDYVKCICPKCGEPYCCDIVFEKL